MAYSRPKHNTIVIYLCLLLLAVTGTYQRWCERGMWLAMDEDEDRVREGSVILFDNYEV